ncbi:RNA-directed DNA polymerase, eukaryota [Tanacetum coccineum]
MGELKSFSSIPNIRVLLQKEGFQIVSLSYLGGLWVMFELKSKVSKEKLLDHVGVSSWFHQICSAQLDFVAKERIVWIDIEGTEDNILEKFKVVLRGKVFVIRVKELFVWSPVFKEVDDEGYCSDVESSKEDKVVGDTDIEQPERESKLSSDPFDIYGLLRKQGADNIDKRVDNDQSQGADSAAKTVENEHELSGNVADSSIPFPPGFTPPTPKDASIEQEVFDSGLLVQSQKKGGSILELLDDVVKVGQAMGFSMVGCEKDIEGLGSKAKKDWIRELLVKYRVNFLSLQETKASTVLDMDVKMFWVSDNFIALYGLWKPTKTKLLVISVYAPQALSEKRTLQLLRANQISNRLCLKQTEWTGNGSKYILSGTVVMQLFVEGALDSMKGSLAKARVLYAPVEVLGGEDRLLHACKVISDAFTKGDLVLEKDAKQTLKLHATVMNARHRKRTKFVFDQNGYYHCCASMPLPRNMEDCMKGSLAKARVLYAPVEVLGGEDRLLHACKVISDAFTKGGLVREKDAKQTLKLHATVMNARHRKRTKNTKKFDSFDARGFMEKYGSEDRGEYVIPEVHLSQRFVFDQNGYYHCCASMPLPKNMEVD